MDYIKELFTPELLELMVILYLLVGGCYFFRMILMRFDNGTMTLRDHWFMILFTAFFVILFWPYFRYKAWAFDRTITKTKSMINPNAKIFKSDEKKKKRKAKRYN